MTKKAFLKEDLQDSEKEFNPIVVCGSGRNNGNTAQMLLSMIGDIPTVFLCDLNIQHYAYDHSNELDDFLPLIERLILCNPIVFATPVYWYAMGSRMKVFWDRITDLFHHHKHLLYRLQGKTIVLIVSSGSGKPLGFEIPMEKTCAYLKMNYVGCWDYIFPMEKHIAHNHAQKTAFQTQWNILSHSMISQKKSL